jgi:hypothetical protein
LGFGKLLMPKAFQIWCIIRIIWEAFKKYRCLGLTTEISDAKRQLKFILLWKTQLCVTHWKEKGSTNREMHEKRRNHLKANHHH